MNTDAPRSSARPARRPPRAWLLAPAVLALSACSLPTITPPQSDSVRHFTLSSPGALAAPDAARVRPVELAGHLRNRSMAVRIAENEVVYRDEARWAEPLDDAITNLLRARLGAAGGGCTVDVQVLRCELVRNEGNTVQLSATYVITPDPDPAGQQPPAKRGVFNAQPRAWEGGDYGVLVGHIRDAINELGDALVTQAAALQRPVRR
ncbi:MAG TPA: ABC-type transport auxiliary lipoprotein family protein [Opitutaceae bacterium]|nr:ABC-type transport auxiliary lipoprotein family protein [Opitutaceae bacterium]